MTTKTHEIRAEKTDKNGWIFYNIETGEAICRTNEDGSGLFEGDNYLHQITGTGQFCIPHGCSEVEAIAWMDCEPEPAELHGLVEMLGQFIFDHFEIDDEGMASLGFGGDGWFIVAEILNPVTLDYKIETHHNTYSSTQGIVTLVDGDLYDWLNAGEKWEESPSLDDCVRMAQQLIED